METIERNTIFTNCALTDDGDIWWEGMTGEPPAHAIDWHGNDWTPTPRSRPPIPTRASRRRRRSARRSRPSGGPGRRADRRLPVRRPPGVGGAAGQRSVRLGTRGLPRRDDVGRDDGGGREVGKLRFDPMAMLPFCGYNMGDYFAHWLKVGAHPDKLPKVFLVNWFRKDERGKFWPGFGENSRVLEWICRRCDGDGETVDADRPGAGGARDHARRARRLRRADARAA